MQERLFEVVNNEEQFTTATQAIQNLDINTTPDTIIIETANQHYQQPAVAQKVVEIMASTQIVTKLIDTSGLGAQVEALTKRGSSFTGGKTAPKGLWGLLARLARFVLNPKNWLQKKRLWIGSVIVLRFAYQFCREYGLTINKKKLNKDHIFLTGAGSGIGRLMARTLGKMGCKLSLSDINFAGVQETQEILVKDGVTASNILIQHLDVTKKEQIHECAEKSRSQFGPITILINNAGIVSGQHTLELSEGAIQRTFNVNTISHLWTIKEFLPDMIKNRRGHIVTIASMAGLTGLPGLSDYCGSKFGAVAIDEAVRLELKQSGDYKYVKTTCICPYFIDTGMFEGAKTAFPMYILTPKETTKRIIDAIQQEEAMVVIPYRGNIIHLMKLFPTSFVDKIGKILGVSSQMEDFQGRGAITARMPGLVEIQKK